MARPKRADINDVNRRNELIAAAAKLFKEKGFHATTTRDIAKAANMTAGSPFYHFASKQDLLYAGVESSLLDCITALEAVDPDAMTPFDYFRTLARMQIERLLDADTLSGVVPMVVDEWRHLEGEQREQIIALRQRFEQLWERALRRAKDAGIAARADVLAVRFFLSALNGIPGWYKPNGSLTPERVADELVNWTLNAPAA